MLETAIFPILAVQMTARNPGNWAQPEEIAFRDITIGTVIGTGSDKTVYLGNFRSRTVAISMFREKKAEANKADEQSAQLKQKNAAEGGKKAGASDLSVPVGPCDAECYVYTHAHLCANIARTVDPKSHIVYMVSELARYGALDRSLELPRLVRMCLFLLAGYLVNVLAN